MKKRLLTVAIVAAMIASLAGCSNGDNKTNAKADTTTETTADTGKENEKDKDYVIGCVLISGTIQHCQLFKQGFEETCAANGAEAVVLDANYDPQVLISSINDLVAKGCDGIVVESCDANAPLAAIKEAANAGVVVAAADMYLDISEEDGTVISQTVSDNYSGGYECGEDVVKRADGKDFNVCIMELQTNTSAVDRVKGFQDAIEGHDNIKVLDIGTPNPENLEQKVAVCDAWVEKFDKIDAIFCYHDPAAIACVSSLKAAGRLENTFIYSVDGNEENLIAIKNGEVTGSAKQDPYKMAQASTEDIFTVLNGGAIDHDYLTKVPITYVDASNVDEFLK
ncbi:sugar ABC transporter substrate-binding protein [Eubacterium sp. am_0171]|uniref:sugar ABC transporter substrate-binding protein n=1 Tax=unclassified Eubacterium (in: firmicutes) TaxID=2624479 RepID=UPI00101EED6F|nr:MULTISPECIES: sugar ABC transporter substrate-binding protein [unclassified Eubacterium (in: firmicutes)]MSC85581.1 substrate-binding domain-containing protein [Eubacterium sp. BIOML-A1]MSD08036.1 substrate-binding domain-containing protein [Eubacterium sp. BIOML-A2]RYT13367.1 sugar ABC transporter substrate-binding protein [Eubacterium sp. am_0171]